MATAKSPERKHGAPRPGPQRSQDHLEDVASMGDMVPAGESAMKLEDQLTNSKLKELEQIFEEADEDGGGGLDMDEFRNAMRKAMGEHLTDHDLDIIFMKVDTNCDGTVDWDEYLSYMLLEYRGKDDMNFENQPKPLPKYLRKVPHMSRYQRHHDSVIGITYLPNVVKAANNMYRVSDETCGRYISGTKEGVMNFWNTDLGHLKSFQVAHTMKYQRKMSVWVTDFVCMPNLNLMCIATTASTLTFYDLTANKFDPILTITELEICATCMDYWINPELLHNSQLIWGDARGNISGLVFDDCVSICFLQPKFNKHFRSKVAFQEIVNGGFCGVRGYKLHNVHEDFVLRIRYIPTLNSFLSCCRGRNTSVFQGDLQKKKAIYFKVRKGVFAFDYCPKNNVLVTGGKDAVVRVWNPYVQSKPVMILQGHKSAVLFVMVNNSMEQIISMSEDKEINIFDMTTQTCIQTIYRKWVPLGPRPISAAYFNQTRQALLLATNQLAIFEHRDEETKSQLLTSHPKPVTIALYNKLFNQIVSGGMDSMVCVWDAVTGEKTIQFLAHTKRSKGGEEINVEITSMRFDPTLRRLITASRDGILKVWNFNNGACLREISTPDNKEITGIIVARQKIVTAGWNQNINVYVDSSEDETVLNWKSVHREDVFCLALQSPGTVASADYDGDIVIWSLDNGHAFNRFNASIGTKPLFISTRRLPDIVKPKQKASPEPTAESARLDTSRTLPSARETDNRPSKAKRINNGKAVHGMVFLQRREVTRQTANLVSVGAEGWVRFWSIHAEGGLLGQFHAGNEADSCIATVAVDEHNELLVTGDSAGYIKVWDITEYCIEQPKERFLLPDLTERREHFLFTQNRICVEKWEAKHSRFPAPPPETDPKRTWKTPPLLNSFRAHMRGVTHVDYVDGDDKLVSCSSDCSIRLWRVYGQFLGICGQDVPWPTDSDPVGSSHKVKPITSIGGLLQRNRENFRMAKKRLEQKLPSDIRKVASASTMRVMCGGIRPHWKLAKNIMTVWLPMLRTSRRDPDDTSNHSVPPLLIEDDFPTSDEDLLKLPSISTSQADNDILGKNFKSNRKHQVVPAVPKLRQFHTLCDVYSALPYYDLDPIKGDIQPPECLVEMRERQHRLFQPTRKTKALFKLGSLAAKMRPSSDTRESKQKLNKRSLSKSCAPHEH